MFYRFVHVSKNVHAWCVLIRMSCLKILTSSLSVNTIFTKIQTHVNLTLACFDLYIKMTVSNTNGQTCFHLLLNTPILPPHIGKMLMETELRHHHIGYDADDRKTFWIDYNQICLSLTQMTIMRSLNFLLELCFIVMTLSD